MLITSKVTLYRCLNPCCQKSSSDFNTEKYKKMSNIFYDIIILFRTIGFRTSDLHYLISIKLLIWHFSEVLYHSYNILHNGKSKDKMR